MVDYFLSYDRALLEQRSIRNQFIKRVRTKVYQNIPKCINRRMKGFFDKKYEFIKFLKEATSPTSTSSSFMVSSNNSDHSNNNNKMKKGVKNKTKNTKNKRKRFFGEVFEPDFKVMILDEIMNKSKLLREYVKKIKIPSYMRGLFFSVGEDYKREEGVDIVFSPFPSNPTKYHHHQVVSSSSSSTTTTTDKDDDDDDDGTRKAVEIIKKRRKAQGGTNFYFGMVNREGLPDGHGVVIREKRHFLTYYYSKVFEGDFKDGLEDGVGREFCPSSKSVLFHGRYKEGLRNGKGVEYRPEYKHAIFTGLYKNEKRDGLGEEYNPTEGKMRKGKWVDGVCTFEYEVYNLKMINYELVRPYIGKAEQLGKGGNGVVYKIPSECFSKCGLKTKGVPFYAVKMIEGSWGGAIQFETDCMMIKKQAQLCSSIRSPNVIEVYAIIEGENLRDRKIGVVMELGKMSVEDLIRIERGTIPKSEKIRIMKETAEGMCSLHERKIMHRDLKWSNVLLDFSRRVKITDFDAIKEDENSFRFSMNSSTYTKCIGTLYFLDPTATTGKYTLSVDVYSFGLMMYSMMFEIILPFDTPEHHCSCGLAFKNMTPITFQRCVRMHHFRPDVSEEWLTRNKHVVDSEVVELMKQCWDAVPSERPSYEEIVEWFRNYQYERYRSKFVNLEIYFDVHHVNNSEDNNNVKNKKKKKKKKKKTSRVLVTDPNIENFVGKLESKFRRKVIELKSTLIKQENEEKKHEQQQQQQQQEEEEEEDDEDLDLDLVVVKKVEIEVRTTGDEVWRKSNFLEQVMENQEVPEIKVSFGERIKKKKKKKKIRRIRRIISSSTSEIEEEEVEGEGERMEIQKMIIEEEEDDDDESNDITVISRKEEEEFYDEIGMRENFDNVRKELSQTQDLLIEEIEKNEKMSEEMKKVLQEKSELNDKVNELLLKITELEKST